MSAPNLDFKVGLSDWTGAQLGTGANPLVTSSGSGASSNQVQGTAAAGAAPVGNPLQTGVSDGSLMRVLLGDTSGRAIVVGAAADGGLATGNPMFIGGSSSGTLRGLSLFNPSTNVNGVGFNLAGVLVDGSLPYQYNGASWDAARNNTDLTILASLARTTTQTVAVTTYNCAGISVYVNVTVAGTGSITPSIQYVDPVSGQTFTILTGTAITTNTTQILRIYPGIAVTANVTASDHVSRVINVVITANNANSITYSVGATLLV